MKYTVTNNGRGPRGVLSASGAMVIIERGQSKVVDVSDAEAQSPSPALAMVPLRGRVLADDFTPEEVATRAADLLSRRPNMKFMVFKSEAREMLGDQTPEKSADIVAALEALVAAGQADHGEEEELGEDE